MGESMRFFASPAKIFTGEAAGNKLSPDKRKKEHPECCFLVIFNVFGMEFIADYNIIPKMNISA